MVDTTNVPAVEFTPTGLVVPTDAEILAGVTADNNAAFGGNLNPSLETPQGQLATSQAAVISNSYAALAEFVNQVDPDTADGFMQDAIARIYFLDRSPGAPTAVLCDCVGLFGTIIPVGAQAQDTSGNRYVCTEATTIPVSGTASGVPFANIVNGPVPCPSDTLTTIFQAIPGWDTVNNPSGGVLGRFVETRAAFEFRRRQSVALNARGSLPSIYAAVFDVPDVLDVYVAENVTNATVPFGSTNFDLVAHSLYVAVVGGDTQAIGEAIWRKKDVGCNYNGNTTVTVEDDSGYSPPVPTYDVTFEIPDPLPIFFNVRIAASADVPADIVALTKAAIIAAFNGADGSQRVRIGSLILASKFVAPVSAIGPTVSILSIEIGTSGPGALDSILAGIDQAPTVDAGDITVTLV